MVDESSYSAKKHLDPTPCLQLDESGSTRVEEEDVEKRGKWWKVTNMTRENNHKISKICIRDVIAHPIICDVVEFN